MIIGRKRELELLEDAYSSHKAQFITVFGRRRVGKTFLVREFFKGKKCHFFHTTGTQGGGRRMQLENFTDALSETFFRGVDLSVPGNWKAAFKKLHKEIEPLEGKVVIFLDELPWMATQRATLMKVLDYYWNKYWVGMPNVMLEVCGSSASWMIKNIIKDRGGFHKRTTLEMQLNPLKLFETREYLRHNGFKLSDKHIVSLYMALGGVPYYLDLLSKKHTAQKNIQMLFFHENPLMRDEFNVLFNSLFKKAEPYKEIVWVVSKKQKGMTQAEIGRMVKLTRRGGTLSKRLKELASSGFLKEFTPWGKGKRKFYKVNDEFCLFYLRWVEQYENADFDEDHWVLQSRSPEYNTWAGYAFEAVCRKHIHKILRAMDIKAATPTSPWRYIPKPNSGEDGAQIDLVVERFDDAITLIEIKYSNRPFIIDKRYAANLSRKEKVFRERTKTTKDIFTAMVAANGIRRTVYSEELLNAVVTLEDLFNNH